MNWLVKLFLILAVASVVASVFPSYEAIAIALFFASWAIAMTQHLIWMNEARLYRRHCRRIVYLESCRRGGVK